MADRISRFRADRFCRSAVVTTIVGMGALWALAQGSPPVGATGPDHSGAPLLSLQEPHVVVIKSQRRLMLFDGKTLIRTYPAALGSAPVGQKRKAGDGRTPEGVFRICTKNARSEHHRFLGIDYPSATFAEVGIQQGLLTTGEARAILAAQKTGRCPPWVTALGGGIGVHGRGPAGGDPSADWTAGCIALSDRDVEELFEVLRIGDRFEILP